MVDVFRAARRPRCGRQASRSAPKSSDAARVRDDAAAATPKPGLKVVMDRCPAIEILAPRAAEPLNSPSPLALSPQATGLSGKIEGSSGERFTPNFACKSLPGSSRASTFDQPFLRPRRGGRTKSGHGDPLWLHRIVTSNRLRFPSALSRQAGRGESAWPSPRASGERRGRVGRR